MRRRVLVVLMIYSVVVVLALSVPLALFVGRERVQRFAENRTAAANFVAELSSREDGSGLPRLRESVARYGSLYGEGIAVLDRTGQPRAVAGLDLERADVQQAVAGALRNQRGNIPSDLTPWSRSSVLVAVPVGGGSQVDGAVVIDASTVAARRDVAVAWSVVAASALLILVTVALIAAVLSRWVVRPLTVLSARVQSFGDTFHDRGRADDDGPEFSPTHVGPPEVRELSSAFDAMAADVRAATAAQRRLVADTAHSLRNPLAALRIRLDLLGMRMPESAADAHLKTTAEVERLGKVVEDVLVLAAAEAPGDTAGAGSDVGAVIADRVEFWSSAADVAGIALTATGPGGMRIASLPDDDLVRILDVLLSNATKYAGIGASVEVGHHLADHHVIVWMSDTGPGVPADELPLIADRFFRASSTKGEGTGLGLSIVRALTERAGGNLEVAARRPTGLRIVMTFLRDC
ncbi:sensor histidine kinase [Actinomycetes bacterium M1A6_2h]